MVPALEINLALWGMMLCAAVQAAQHFEFYQSRSHRTIATAAQPIAINHPTVATPVRASHAHGHWALSLRQPVGSSAGNFASMFTEPVTR